MDKQHIFVNIPVLNEEECVEELIDELQQALSGISHTILFVDDGSTDKTLHILNKRKRVYTEINVLNREKMGKGCQRGGALFEGMKWGLQNTKSTIFVEMDGDLSHKASEFKFGFDMIYNKGCDIVIGSKYLAKSKTQNREISRQSISFFANYFLRTLFYFNVTDYSNGFRFYNTKVASYMANQTFVYTTPIYLSEFLVHCFDKNFVIGEYESTYEGRLSGSSKVELSDLTEAIKASILLALKHHFGFKLPRDGFKRN